MNRELQAYLKEDWRDRFELRHQKYFQNRGRIPGDQFSGTNTGTEAGHGARTSDAIPWGWLCTASDAASMQTKEAGKGAVPRQKTFNFHDTVLSGKHGFDLIFTLQSSLKYI